MSDRNPPNNPDQPSGRQDRPILLPQYRPRRDNVNRPCLLDNSAGENHALELRGSSLPPNRWRGASRRPTPSARTPRRRFASAAQATNLKRKQRKTNEECRSKPERTGPWLWKPESETAAEGGWGAYPGAHPGAHWGAGWGTQWGAGWRAHWGTHPGAHRGAGGRALWGACPVTHRGTHWGAQWGAHRGTHPGAQWGAHPGAHRGAPPVWSGFVNVAQNQRVGAKKGLIPMLLRSSIGSGRVIEHRGRTSTLSILLNLFFL